MLCQILFRISPYSLDLLESLFSPRAADDGTNVRKGAHRTVLFSICQSPEKYRKRFALCRFGSFREWLYDKV
jgi:hypothetical protein